MYKIALILILSVLFCGCRKSTISVLSDITSSTQQLGASFGCEDVMHEVRYDDFKTTPYIIIKQQKAYDEKVLGTCHPEIKFDKFQLIVTALMVPEDLSVIRHKFYKNNQEKGNYNLSLFIDSKNNSTKNKLAFFSLLIPQKEDIQRIKIAIGSSNASE